MATEPPVFTTGKTASGSTVSTPFFIVPAHPPVGQRAASASGPSRAASSAYHNRSNTSFTQPSAKLQQRAPTTTSTVTAPPPAPIIVNSVGSVSYKAPAHKHAHHLHSIPPREKTVKTLILDHMLWQHSRARFLQARSELGLSPALTPQQQQQQQQQKHQQLPQSPTSATPPTSSLRARRGSGASALASLLDLDDEGEDADIAAQDRPYSPSDSSQLPGTALWLGKDVEDDIRALKFGVRGIERIKAYLEHHAEDDWYAARVDLDTARVQRATAEGMEKVLTSLLTQSFAAIGLDRPHEHQHHEKDTKKPRFCHDVRMRIALSGLVNDFFARDHSVTSAAAENGSGAQGGYSEEEQDSDYQSQHVAIEERAGVIAQSPMSISSLVTSRSPTSPANTSAAAGLSSDPTSSTRSSRPPPHARSVSRGKVTTLPGSYRDPPLPDALYTLLPVSSYTLPKHINAPFAHSPSSSLSASASETQHPGERRSLAPPNSIFSAVPRGSGPDLPWALGPGNGMGWLARVPAAAAGSGAAARGGDAGLLAGNNGPWQGPGQTSRVWKPIGRSRELFNGGVSRGQQAQQRQPPSRSRLGAPSTNENDVPLEREVAAASGKAAAASAVGQAACPRHLRETDECPRTCIHATHFSSQLPPTATTAIGAGLAPAGLPLRRPSPVQSTASPSMSRSRSRSIPRSVAIPAYSLDSRALAGTSSLSPPLSSVILGAHANSRRSQSPSRSGNNGKNIPKQGERRESKQKAQARVKAKAASAYDETPMTDILPRFLRFSALVAKELGREARGAGEQSVVDMHTHPATAAGVPEVTMTDSDDRSSTPRMEKSHHWPPQHGKDTIIATGSGSGAKLAPIHQPSTTGDARPTRAWYALLCGIITRAVLEGYIRGRWKGPDPLEMLFGLGLGTTNQTVLKGAKTTDQPANIDSARAKKERKTAGESESESEDEAHSPGLSSSPLSSDDDGEDVRGPSMSPSYAVDPTAFEPDGMPSLEEAVQVLFVRGLLPPPNGTSAPIPLNPSATSTPSFVSPATTVATSASNTDPEWEWETSERISEFATISLNSPDLLTHLQELSRRYPPEPVERAALRFFESVAEWRGTPELETYKARRAQGTAVTAFSKIASEQAKFNVEGGSAAEAPDINNVDEQESSTPTSAVLRYFRVPKELHGWIPSHQTPTPSPSSGGIGSSKKRGPTEDATVSDARTTKSARSDALMIQDEIEPGWTRPYGV